MALSCSCESEYEWYYKLTKLKHSAGNGICYGCGKKIRTGDPVAKIIAFDIDEDGQETESKVKSLMCEPCIDMHDNLEALGYCLEANPFFVADAHKEYLARLLPQHRTTNRGKK